MVSAASGGSFSAPSPYAAPPPVNVDSGVPACNVKKCSVPDVGIACCTNSGKCGVDATGSGLFCVVPVAPTDAAVPDAGQISTMPPDDPSVDGQCPSHIGLNGAPIWACCSKYGVCGTFAANQCLLPVGAEIPIDYRVYGFVLSLVVLITMVLGVAPLLWLRRSSLSHSLGSGPRTAGSRIEGRTRTALLVTQIALTVVLLSGAGLFLKTVRNLNNEATPTNETTNPISERT